MPLVRNMAYPPVRHSWCLGVDTTDGQVERERAGQVGKEGKAVDRFQSREHAMENTWFAAANGVGPEMGLVLEWGMAA